MRRKRIIEEINDKSPIQGGDGGLAQDTMKFVKRRIQDTGAT